MTKIGEYIDNCQEYIDHYQSWLPLYSIGTHHESEADRSSQDPTNFAQIIRKLVADNRVQARVYKSTPASLQINFHVAILLYTILSRKCNL